MHFHSEQSTQTITLTSASLPASMAEQRRQSRSVSQSPAQPAILPAFHYQQHSMSLWVKITLAWPHQQLANSGWTKNAESKGAFTQYEGWSVHLLVSLHHLHINHINLRVYYGMNYDGKTTSKRGLVLNGMPYYGKPRTARSEGSWL